MGRKVERTREGGTLTEAEYFGKIRSALRKKFQHWGPMKHALKAARRPSQSANKRLKFEYQCADCGGWFPESEVEIDHKVPCGSLNSLDDIKSFVERLTSENPDDFQVLCKIKGKRSCHQEKTNYETMQRKDLKTQWI